MNGRPTIKDVARLAGVSVATVDRVVNGRHPVRTERAHKVFEAAESLGFYATGLIQSRISAKLPQQSIGVLLQQPKQQFYQNFAKAVGDASANLSHLGLHVVVDFLPSQRHVDVVEALRAMAQRVEAVAMVAIDHPIINEAVAELRQSGIPVFTLLSDFAINTREVYLGTNNLQAGRTSAWFVNRGAKRTGKIALCVGSHRFHGHELRESGFRSYFREHAPDMSLLETLVNLEDDAIMYDATFNLLKRHPDLTGLYIAGGGMEGAIAALREERQPGEVAMVCSELTTDTRLGLAQNILTAVLATPLAALCESLLDIIHQTLTSKNRTHSGQVFLPFDIFLSENI